MYEAGDFQCLIPEDEYENHLTVLNKSSLQLHRLSLQRSNLTSQILQEGVWESNARLFNEDAMDSIIASANAILQNTGPGNTDSWECGISKYNPNGHITFDLVDRSLNPCELCNSKQNIESKTLEKFFNNECKCQLNLNETRKNKVKENKRGQIEPDLVGNPEVWSLDSPETSQDYTGDKYFNAKFGRQKTKSSYKPLSKEPKSEKPSVSEEKTPYNSYIEEDTWVKKSKNQKKNEEIDFEKIEEENKAHKSNVAKITFRTAKEQLLATNPAVKRSLGATRKAQSKFVSPMIGAQDNKQESSDSGALDDRLKHIDPKMVELIESEIIDKGTPIGWDDIAGLTLAKSTIQEAVVWPLLRPDMFTGLRRPPKGILLFGPPGTGKTLIGKCVAAQCHATFFSISASSLTSKWIGDGEKMVRALFAVARCYQPAVSIEPSVIFIDEIDSLLTARSDSEHEATRRIKTEFLVQFDGANTADDDRLLVVGATNRPQELDEAARRRLVKRLYIPLPDLLARQQIITNLLQTENNNLSPSDIMDVSRLTDGYSGADMKSLCSEAAMGPIRAVPFEQIATIQRDKVRPVNAQDFVNALQRVRPSVSQDDLGQYEKWNKTYGQGF